MVRCREWCGYCYAGATGRKAYKGHYGWHPPSKERTVYVGSVLRRRLKDGSHDEAGGRLDVCSVLDPVPGVREMLVEARFPDGSARQTSTLLVFVEDGVVKCCLNDRDQGMTAWASGSSVADCLEALEAGLQQDSLQWRQSTQKRGGKRGK